VATATLVVMLTGCAVAPAPTGLASEVVDDVVGERRDALWNSYFGDAGLERPEVAMVEYTSPDDLMQRYVICMHDAGYTAVHRHGDGLSLGADGDSGLDAYLALWVCAAQYPVHPALMGYLSADDRGYLWDYWNTRTIPCLRALGFEVPDLSARDGFLASPGGYPASPYALVDPSELGWDVIDAACPPPSEDRFGAWHP
jgi:hypothetical protein